MPLGDRLGGIADLFKTFKELLPLILEFIECFKEMDPAVQKATARILAKRATDDPNEQQELQTRIERLAA